jgi:hypothetical protein
VNEDALFRTKAPQVCSADPVTYRSAVRLGYPRLCPEKQDRIVPAENQGVRSREKFYDHHPCVEQKSQGVLPVWMFPHMITEEKRGGASGRLQPTGHAVEDSGSKVSWHLA